MIALGGNALLRRDERPDASIELEHVRSAAAALAPLCRDHAVLICHGNGPQIGLLAIESTSDPTLTRPYPLDALGAQTQGLIAYWLAQSLHNEGVVKPIAGVLSQVIVDRTDPAFARPEKFIGAGHPLDEAQRSADAFGWTIGRDGDLWRRVVASPEPLRVVEQDTITDLLDRGTVVICGGGGGAPVAEDDAGRRQGMEAVVDKDLTSALLAVAVAADMLIVLTDVAAVMTGFGTTNESRITALDIGDLDTTRFAAGSMAPKLEACRRFVATTGRRAAIGALTDAAEILAGTAGTAITKAPTR